jgi:DNA polymerase III epsilon subunit-like protein
MLIAAFDTETTGVTRANPQEYQKYNNARMIQLAIIVYKLSNGKADLIGTYSWYVKPEGFQIQEGVHGITHDKAVKQGLPIVSVLQEVQKILTDVELLLAHNFQFDHGILSAEIYRYLAETMDESFLPLLVKLNTTSYFCTMKGLACLFDGRHPNLTNLHKKVMGKDFDNKHDAIYDTKAVMDIFLNLYQKGKIVLQTTAN